MMDTSKKPMPVVTVHQLKNQINTNPDYQRPPVWTRSQKQLLIDTILRNYDVPKMYWRKIGSRPDKFEVVDGQQRLRALWEFIEGQYKLSRDADSVENEAIAGLGYQELPFELHARFDTYPLDVVVIADADEDEVREMFLRLQSGTTLKAQEKRNAMPGKMRDFIHNLTSHSFFNSVNFANSRYTYDHISAQITLMEISGGPCNVKNANLNKMYAENLAFDPNGSITKKVKRVLDFLNDAFPESSPDLERYNVITLYAMASNLLENYVIKERASDLAAWFSTFEQYRTTQKMLSEDECDPEIIAYHEKTSHSTDSEESIRWRYEYLMRKFFEAVPNIELKDQQRGFTAEQRKAIFKRDGGICKIKMRCEGLRCTWDNWHADHILPHSLGGKTIVSNGQVACSACNLAKSSRSDNINA